MDQSEGPSSTQEENNLCPICYEISELKCAGCGLVYYCNRKHQKLDWKNHRISCSVLKLVEEPSGQKYYIAKRDIMVGEKVYEEKEPLVMGPKICRVGAPSCLGCYETLTEAIAVPCQKCGWPLCEDCKTHGPECEFTSEFMKTKISITDYNKLPPEYGAVISMRTLALRMKNPSAYNKIVKLRERAVDESLQLSCMEASEAAFQQIIKRAPVKDSSILIEMRNNNPAMRYFAHGIIIDKNPLVAVYENVSYFKNDCRANCSKIISETGGISIRAALPISKGENVTICYVDPKLHAMRRRMMLSDLYINCQCTRCKDPTEFGTMYNAVNCIVNSCNGYMLPPTFIVKDNEEVPNFVCSECPMSINSQLVESMVMHNYCAIQTLVGGDVHEIQKYLFFLNTQRQIFHENHSNIFAIKNKLLIIFGNQNDRDCTPDELLVEKINCCEDVLNIFESLLPTERPDRGVILFFLSLYLEEYWSRNTTNSDTTNRDCENSMKILTTADAMLQHIPQNSYLVNIAKCVKITLNILKDTSLQVNP